MERAREEKGLPTDQEVEHDEELERIDEDEMEVKGHGDKLQHAVDAATKDPAER